MREILSVEQPCVLCEAPLEVWTIEHDDETGEENIRMETFHHDCAQMQALVKERFSRLDRSRRLC